MPVAGGTTRKVVEGLAAPFQEFIALAIALELALGVVEQSEAGAEVVHLHRMVDDQIDRDQGIDLGGVAAHAGHGVAQRRQIDDRRDAGEILHDDARRLEWHLFALGLARLPIGQGDDVILGDLEAVALSQRRLEQHFDRVGQARDVGDAALLQRAQAIHRDLAAAGVEHGFGVKTIL